MSTGPSPPKLVFGAPDVAMARAALMARGAGFGKVKAKDGLALCDGKDPDGNPPQLSDPRLGGSGAAGRRVGFRFAHAASTFWSERPADTKPRLARPTSHASRRAYRSSSA